MGYGTRAFDGMISRRQLDVVRLVAGGHSNAQIALRLGIAERTVRGHLTTIYRRLGCGSRYELMTLAWRQGRHMDVIELDGSVHDLAWLQGRYGAGLTLHLAQGYPRFELKTVFVTEGPTILRFTVFRADGALATGQPVANTWPSLAQPAEDLPAVPAGADRSGWMRRALLERCGTQGAHEMQIGSQSWIKGDRGPYAVQVISPSAYSDCLEGVGWLGGTNHRGPCEFIFELVEQAGPDPVPTPTPTPGTGDYTGIMAVLNDLRTQNNAILDAIRQGFRL